MGMWRYNCDHLPLLLLVAENTARRNRWIYVRHHLAVIYNPNKLVERVLLGLSKRNSTGYVNLP